MIISQTPLRVSFFGGGTDFEGYYIKHGGLVLSATINKYIYLIINPRPDNNIVLNYSKREIVQDVNQIEHNIFREVLKFTQITKSIEITSISDITSEGSGLGSSSAFIVGLLNAIYTYKGITKKPHELAELACKIEIDILGSPIGKQDQYAVAFGGLRKYHFNKDGSVLVNKIDFSAEHYKRFKNNTLLFNTGITRKVSPILSVQKANIEVNFNHLNMLKEIAIIGENYLTNLDFKNTGNLLNTSWEKKKLLSNKINNDEINRIYELGKKAGVFGGKLLGAGGGGFFLFLCPPEKQNNLRTLLKDYQELHFEFEKHGSSIIYNNMGTQTQLKNA